jgi:predicted nucleic acid-binding protein
MRSVVIDASPIILFAKAAEFDTLQHVLQAFNGVWTSEDVFQEVAGPHAVGWPGERELKDARGVWVQVATPAPHSLSKLIGLELSEADWGILDLALDLDALLVTDDLPLRLEAERHGVPCTGSLGLL